MRPKRFHSKFAALRALIESRKSHPWLEPAVNVTMRFGCDFTVPPLRFQYTGKRYVLVCDPKLLRPGAGFLLNNLVFHDFQREAFIRSRARSRQKVSHRTHGAPLLANH